MPLKVGWISLPNDPVFHSRYHNLKYAVFKEMLKDQRKYNRIMNTLDA